MSSPTIPPTKYCHKCSRELPTESFRTRVYHGKTTLDSCCRECEKRYRQEFRKTEHSKAWRKEYDSKSESKRRKQLRDKAYRQTSQYKALQKKIRERPESKSQRADYVNSEKYKAWEKEYSKRESTRKIKVINQQRRKMRQKSLPANFTLEDWQYALDYFGGCCAVCGRPPGLWHKLAQDHWIPISMGGAYAPDNIVPLCHGEGGCNNSKKNRDPVEWLTKKFGLRKANQIQKRIERFLTARR